MSANHETDDLRIKSIKEVSPPDVVRGEYPLGSDGRETVYQTRDAIHNILYGKDDRLLVVVGPCSVHDVGAALEYAGRLSKVRDRLQDDLLIVMRVYFEKPRTTVGWKGLINDPSMDGSFHINKGLRLARQLLVELAAEGIPAATEYLDLISPQYIADVVSWGAIGARTTESQVHRELASGLSCPVGFKNGTDGNMQIAIDAIGSASRPHNFLSVTKDGHSAIFTTTGNEDCHLILRGGNGQPNYDAEHVAAAVTDLENAGVNPRLMVDCSHANSSKQHDKQVVVANDIAQQLADGQDKIMGVMIESHLEEGRQDIALDGSMVYGKSVTDACISWDMTEPVLERLADGVRQRRARGL
ncbi:MAG: 3-deoxy-7-phosphoheptulonate synthase [bacterium]